MQEESERTRVGCIGYSQEHKLYTGTSYDLTNTTEGGSAVTAGINGSATMSFTDGVSRKLVCT